MTSRRPYWCHKTMKRRPCWCPKPILWELNSFLMQTLSFVPINLHRYWPREWKHSIVFSSELRNNKKFQQEYAYWGRENPDFSISKFLTDAELRNLKLPTKPFGVVPCSFTLFSGKLSSLNSLTTSTSGNHRGERPVFSPLCNPCFISKKKKNGPAYHVDMNNTEAWNKHLFTLLRRMVQKPILYVMIHFQDWRGAASLRHKNRFEITVRMWTKSLSVMVFVPCGARAVRNKVDMA